MSDVLNDLMADLQIPFTVQQMKVQDIPEVMAIEKDSFPLPWSAGAYRYELTQNEHSHYLIVRKREPPPVPPRTRRFERWFRKPHFDRPVMIGYGGFWVLGDEAHISTIAVRTDWRGRGIGELLLLAMIDRATALKAEVVTLEVRVSNIVAQNLYRKYLFETVGRRRRYYRDNNEDALIMTTPPIDDPAYQEMYHRHRAALSELLRKPAASSDRKATKHQP